MHVHLVLYLRTLIIILLNVDAHDYADYLSSRCLLLCAPIHSGSDVFVTFVLIREIVKIVQLLRFRHQLSLHGIRLR